VTGALARIITHWRKVAAPHGCHFENYLAQDLRIIWRATPQNDNQAVRSAKLFDRLPGVRPALEAVG
jgi:hypothetical protein